MTTESNIQQWIDEHRAIHEAATEGPWSYFPDTRLDGLPVYRVGSEKTGEDVLFITRYQHDEDGMDIADAVADAHNVTVPTALSMIEAALKLHHGERDEYGCWTCRFCSHIQQMDILYPCATVRAIEGAINGE